MTGLRVLQIHKSYAPAVGGIETHLQLLSEGLAARGCNVTVLVCNRGPRTVVERRGRVTIIRVASLGKLFSMDLGPGLLWWARRVPVDVAHLHVPYPLGDLALSRLPRGIPRVVTWHSDIVRQHRLMHLYWPIQQRVLAGVDRIIATSPDYVASSHQLAAHRERVRVIPLGLPVERYVPGPEILARVEQLRAQYGRPLILGVGRLVSYKGWEYLLQAMRTAPGHAVIVGEGPLEGRLRQQLHRQSLTERVTLTGPVDAAELLAWYHACECLVLPSVGRNEAFGLVQVEAMLCGKPVISTRLETGVPFVNQAGVTGVVVPPRDSAALAAAISALAGDEQLRFRLGAAGRERARQLFASDACCDQVLSLYQQLCGAAPHDS